MWPSRARWRSLRERDQASAAASPQPAGAAPDREALDNRGLEMLIGWTLREDSNCVDVGAHQGRFLQQMVTRAPRGRHFAWEPIPELAARLREAYPAVDVHAAALSDRSGEAEFVQVLDDSAYSGLRERAYPGDYRTRRISVELERLDDALPEDYAPHFIKIDVEGNELQVFLGGLRTITRHRPVIAFEHGLGASERYGTTPEAVHDLLCGEAGYRIFDFDATGPLSRKQLGDLFASGARWNYAALP